MKRLVFVLLLAPSMVVGEASRYLMSSRPSGALFVTDGDRAVLRCHIRCLRPRLQHRTCLPDEVGSARPCVAATAPPAGAAVPASTRSSRTCTYPARRDLNHKRGAYPYREIAGEQWIEPGCDFEIDYRARVVEPRPASRGNIARDALWPKNTGWRSTSATAACYSMASGGPRGCWEKAEKSADCVAAGKSNRWIGIGARRKNRDP